MKKITAFLVIGVFFASVISVPLFTDQLADAGSRKKIHFTQTFTSSQDPGIGHENHQLALILHPNEGVLYDGSMTFSSSEPVQIVVLHEINAGESRGQPVWTVDGDTVYGLSLIDLNKKSGSFEFTGSALALHSPSSEDFTATVSVDGWIRGQPIEVMLQKIELEKEDPSLTLSRTNLPVTIPMHQGIHEGHPLLYVITDGSDKDYSKKLSQKQGWNIELAPPLGAIPEDDVQRLFIFKNGVRGDGIYGFQDEVFSSTPKQKSDYTALAYVTEVTWKTGQKEIVFESVDDILMAEEGGRVELTETGVVLNVPQITWNGGQMTIRPDKEIGDETPYAGGQITEINEEEMTVTFVAHRGWGPDGRTVYHIVTGATPSGPAKTMGVSLSSHSENFVALSATSNLFQFKNGIKGTGSLGFQPGVADAANGDVEYSPIWQVHLVEWNNADSARILETKSDIDSFVSNEMISVSVAKHTNRDYIVNAPLIDPFQ